MIIEGKMVGGLNGLPNEVLLLILLSLPTDTLARIASTSRRLYALILRIIHNRMTLATSLDDHTLMLECYHPSAKLTAPKMYCTYIGTDGLDSALECDDGRVAGRLGFLKRLYSRFQPYRQETGRLIQQRTFPGDIPGSRTHPASAQNQRETRLGVGVLPTETVSMDAHELFSQLCVVSHMAKMAARKMVVQSFVELSDGVIRLRRDWLSQQLNKVTIEGATDHHEASADSSILWVNNCNEDVGIKFRVRQHKTRQDNPILFASEEEVAVSYYVEFEELLVRTTRLLRKVEEAVQQQYSNASGDTKAIVFGTFS